VRAQQARQLSNTEYRELPRFSRPGLEPDRSKGQRKLPFFVIAARVARLHTATHQTGLRVYNAGSLDVPRLCA
jgi:hypothetical protein